MSLEIKTQLVLKLSVITVHAITFLTLNLQSPPDRFASLFFVYDEQWESTNKNIRDLSPQEEPAKHFWYIWPTNIVNILDNSSGSSGWIHCVFGWFNYIDTKKTAQTACDVPGPIQFLAIPWIRALTKILCMYIYFIGAASPEKTPKIRCTLFCMILHFFCPPLYA